MSQKKLPFKRPPILSYLYHAFRLGIIWDCAECLPWFHSNYIQILCEESFSDGEDQFHFDFYPIWYDYAEIPWLFKSHFFEKDTVSIGNIDINQLITKYIDRDYYLYTFVDEFFIPNRLSYQTRHLTHDIMVFGYDMEREIFNIIGFDDHFRFRESEVGFLEYRKAFDTNTNDRVYFFKKYDKCNYTFDLKLVFEFLNEYLLSMDSSERFRPVHNPEKNYTYGIKVYECLKRYLELVLMDQIEGYIIIPLQIFWEHKVCMLLRLKYMEENGYLDNLSSIYERYQNIERNFLIARNLMLKYWGSKNKKDISRLIVLISKMEVEEREALLELQDKIGRVLSARQIP